MDIIDRYLDESLLSEEEKREVQRIAGQYNSLDMDLFISRVGGSHRIDEMRKINDELDNITVINGVVQKRRKNTENDIEEWKRGFMEGFEEAYKRLNR